MLEKIGNLLQGKKTYIITVLIFIAGGLQASGIVIPEIAWSILGGLGLAAVRSGINKSGPSA